MSNDGEPIKTCPMFFAEAEFSTECNSPLPAGKGSLRTYSILVAADIIRRFVVKVE
jgi:hypothetical protein